MRRTFIIFVWILAGTVAVGAVPARPAQQSGRVVDRIVARIEDDIILQSQVKELGAFQQLVEGQSESDGQLLSELIEQWVVQSEATASRFPDPAQSEVDRELARLASRFANLNAYSAKLSELGFSATQVRQLLQRQIYVERYLDYKFRPSVQIESADIDAYYQKDLLPELARKNQPAPSRAEVEDQIRELLTQRGISDLTAKWLDETKSRLKIELTPTGAKP
jgi:parvulin-like peptidyl-prolyl isomerase